MKDLKIDRYHDCKVLSVAVETETKLAIAAKYDKLPEYYSEGDEIKTIEFYPIDKPLSETNHHWVEIRGSGKIEYQAVIGSYDRWENAWEISPCTTLKEAKNALQEYKRKMTNNGGKGLEFESESPCGTEMTWRWKHKPENKQNWFIIEYPILGKARVFR